MTPLQKLDLHPSVLNHFNQDIPHIQAFKERLKMNKGTKDREGKEMFCGENYLNV